jgi:ParB/RepB/Spo0J family partition protein
MQKTEVKTIAITEIVPNEVALRGVNKEAEDYQNLMASIKQNGLLNPIVVRPKSVDGKDFFELVDGLQRFSACCDAGIPEIPVHIMKLSDAQVLEAQVLANVHRIETKPVEYSKQLQKILGCNATMTISELATKLSKSPTWVGERLGLLRLDKNIGALVDEEKINLSNAYALAKLPPDEQAAFVDRAQTMKPNEFVPLIQQRAKEIREARRQGKKVEAAEFVPIAHLQKVSVLKSELTTPQILPALIKEFGVKNPVDAAMLTLQWVLHLDQKSIEAAQILDEQRKRSREEAKQRRKAEREKQKAADAAKKAVEIEANLTK